MGASSGRSSFIIHTSSLSLQGHDEVVADEGASLDFVDDPATHDHSVFDDRPRRYTHVIADDCAAQSRAALDLNTLPQHRAFDACAGGNRTARSLNDGGPGFFHEYHTRFEVAVERAHLEPVALRDVPDDRLAFGNRPRID